MAAVAACLAGTAIVATPAQAAKRSDLTVGSLSGVPASIAAGGAFTARAEVRNVGRARARRSTLVFVLSRDESLGGADRALASVPVKALAPRRGTHVQARILLPPTLGLGGYRLLACADAGRVVRERRETNNCRASRTLTVTGGGLPLDPPLPGEPPIPGGGAPPPAPPA